MIANVIVIWQLVCPTLKECSTSPDENVNAAHGGFVGA